MSEGVSDTIDISLFCSLTVSVIDSVHVANILHCIKRVSERVRE